MTDRGSNIPKPEKLVVLAEIKAGLFEKAFVEMAVEFHRRDPKGFELSAGKVRDTLDRFDTRRFLPPAYAELDAVELKAARQDGLRDALAAFRHALLKIGKRLG